MPSENIAEKLLASFPTQDIIWDEEYGAFFLGVCQSVGVPPHIYSASNYGDEVVDTPIIVEDRHGPR